MTNLVILFSGTDLKKDSLFKNTELEFAYQNFIRIGTEEGFYVSISIPMFVSGKNVGKGITFNSDWKRVKNYTADYIFEKLDYGGKRKKILKEISEYVKVINHPDMSIICDDKFLAYNTFAKYSTQTFEISKENFREVIEKIKSQKVVFKPRYGSQSVGIIITDKSQATSDDIGHNYIAQEYIDTRGGIKKISRQNALRCLILNGEMIFLTLETAEKGEIISGDVKSVKVSKNDLPWKKIEIILKEIESVFGKYYPRLYCVDFFVTEKGRVYIAEINSKTGLYPSKGESQKDYDIVIRKFFRSLK